MAIRRPTGVGLWLALLLCPGAPAGAFEIEDGISGSWYDPTQDGHGFLLEVLSGGRLVAYWFAYDGQGNQAWMTGLGTIQGNTASVPVSITQGGVFGPDFNPDAVNRQDWGSLFFSFDSCDTGSVTYNVGFGSGALNLRRLTSLEGLDCDRSQEPVLYPFDGVWQGRGVSTTPADISGDACGSGEFTLTITSHDIAGSGANDDGTTFTVGGRVEPDGQVRLGFAIGVEDAATFEGRLSGNSGGGAWEEVWGCEGTWTVSRG